MDCGIQQKQTRFHNFSSTRLYHQCHKRKREPATEPRRWNITIYIQFLRHHSLMEPSTGGSISLCSPDEGSQDGIEETLEILPPLLVGRRNELKSCRVGNLSLYIFGNIPRNIGATVLRGVDPQQQGRTLDSFIIFNIFVCRLENNCQG